MSVPSASFKKVDDYYGVDGGVSAANIEHLKENYNSGGVLYLCGDDSGAEGGFAALENAFVNAFKAPLDPALPEYQTDCHKHLDRVVAAYRKFETFLDMLPTPTVIVCKSANRASAVLAAYKSVKLGYNTKQMLHFANESDLKFVGTPGLLAWVTTVVENVSKKNALVFRQLFEKESSTYTYLLADEATKHAVLIDPVLETVARDAQLVKELGLTLKYVLNTHVHADHITGSGALKALHPGCKSVLSAAAQAVSDVAAQPNEYITFGTRALKVLPTPGHTAGCVSYVLDDESRVFTGDALLIRGCGRTDFQGGSPTTLYESVHSQILSLPPACLVHPAHDYKGNTCSSVREELLFNPRLTKTLPEFVDIMNNLNLPYPAKFDKSVPANLMCGVFQVEENK